MVPTLGRLCERKKVGAKLHDVKNLGMRAPYQICNTQITTLLLVNHKEEYQHSGRLHVGCIDTLFSPADNMVIPSMIFVQVTLVNVF
jgi:hypothetical protein